MVRVDLTTVLRQLRVQSKVDTPNQTSFTAIHWDQTQTVCHTWIESMDIKPSRSVYVPNVIPSVRLQLFKYGGNDNAQ